VQKPGTLSHGSGTSPTLIGEDLLAIADDGHVYSGNALETEPGIMRVDVREDRSGCDVAWYNKEMLSQSLPRL
jgi:hypothetical protein